ncbi:hypothetical protein BH09PSE5_BH09PSE5_32360 [soil metagenome]
MNRQDSAFKSALRLHSRTASVLTVALLVLATSTDALATGPSDVDLAFTTLLDGKPIGEHRFSITSNGNSRQVVSEASFAVKVMGLTVYRYKHKAVEQWKGDCLSEMIATTDDDGKALEVKASAAADGSSLDVVGSAGTRSLPGCVMSFAYWNPAILKQTKLLNGQTGEYESVQLTSQGEGDVEVRGKTVSATLWRISGPVQPVDIWLTAKGDWVGLDSTVAGGRKLTYRLRGGNPQ